MSVNEELLKELLSVYYSESGVSESDMSLMSQKYHNEMSSQEEEFENTKAGNSCNCLIRQAVIDAQSEKIKEQEFKILSIDDLKSIFEEKYKDDLNFNWNSDTKRYTDGQTSLRFMYFIDGARINNLIKDGE